MSHWRRLMDVSRRGICRRCGLPEALQDPYRLWDSLPCPPPWNKDIIFSTEWNRRLGLEEGLRIIFRIARRCNITTPDTHQLPGRVAASMILTSCEAGCRSVVVLTCLILLIAGVFIVAYLIYTSERHRKLTIAGKKAKRRWNSAPPERKANGDSSHVSFGGQTEVKNDICRRELYVTLEGVGGSPPTGENVRFMHHCQLNTYGNLPDTPVAGHSNLNMSMKGQGRIDGNSPVSPTVTTFQSDTKSEGRGDPIDHFYETLGRKSSTKSNTSDEYKQFRDNSVKLETPIEEDSRTTGEDKSPVDHLYETLSLRNGLKSKLDFPSCGKTVDTPLAGNVVRRWEYQATLNRKARIRWTDDLEG
ncbi:uncharacterized protein LOC117323683 [Pecten maximus]|uniref:uncharacterized protein LOC117323683 n=1 Tax=Pecten maximus TaxID=6579 RepID=UPI001458378C|nr:uncharacterized protein LOC117323683 [Pecten maximus]XP_033734948.1 uncharacterized protein LOC117323683 [Pecten maximus]XP_033734949.1 uncharacterized protein LOC117323683 [Pecten maximus]XP_033734950.1 uncharacterized protein LOC117323683 [Pecten maximus]